MADTNETTETTETDERDDVEPTEDPETGDEGNDTTNTTEPDGSDGDGGGEDWRAKAELYKAQMRKNEQRAKANHAENQKLREELEALRAQAAKPKPRETPQDDEGGEDPVTARMEQLAAELAEIRKTSHQLAEENKRVKHQQLVAEVAAAKGLTVDQARRLQGETREELEADADEVIALFGLNNRKGPAPKPRERRPVRGGATNPDEQGDGRTREEILAAVTSTGRRIRR